MRVGFFGLGNIGREVYRRVQEEGWEPGPVVRSDGVYRGPDKSERLGDSAEYLPLFDGVDIAFLTIPTTDDGSAALQYTNSLLENGIWVVTAEKGMLGNHFAAIHPNIHHIGYSATVGGGTRLLRYLKERTMRNRFDRLRFNGDIHLVLNATMNYIFDALASGRPYGIAVNEAIRLGLAEPGATNPTNVLNQEGCKDVPLKTAIVCNVSGLFPDPVTASSFNPHQLEEEDVNRLIREAGTRRYIVSITKQKNDENVIGGFSEEVDGWHISAGFKQTDENPLYHHLALPGSSNALLISEGKDGSDGVYLLSGPGAGPEPTAASMMRDARKLSY